MPEPSASGLSASKGSPEEDRRVWVRYPSARATYCRPVEGDEPFLAAQACDISRGGVKLLSTKKFERGTILTIGKLDGDADKVGLLTAEVRYAIPSPEDRWIIGCSFQNQLGEEELLAWLKEQE